MKQVPDRYHHCNVYNYENLDCVSGVQVQKQNN